MGLLFCTILCAQVASAAEYTLNSTTGGKFSTGISYDGEEDLVLTIEEDSVIAAGGNADIESAAPVTIRSPTNARLTIAVENGKDAFYGIKAPSVTVESGTVDITVTNGGNNRADSAAYGIDSKYGSVKISGNPVIFIHEDENGARGNFAYNENMTTITGGNAVVFTSKETGSYLLRENAVLTQDMVLLPGKIFEIPAGMTLGLSGPHSLTLPAASGLLFGDGHGAFTYAGTTLAEGGSVVYAGEKSAA